MNALLELKVGSPESQVVNGRVLHGIQPTPSFPALTSTATLPSDPEIDLSTCGSRWRFVITYSDEVRNDTVSYPVDTQWESTQGPAWQPLSPIIAGGDLVVYAEIDLPDGTVASGASNPDANRVLGMNPTHDVVRNSVTDGVAYQAVFWRETRFTQFRDGRGVSNQFVSGMHGPIKGMDPGGTVGYGLGQLTTPMPAIRDLWDWTWNVVDSVTLLKSFRSDAIVYAKQVQAGSSWDSQTGGRPPNEGVAYPEAPEFSEDQLNLEMFARYNGGYRYHNYDPQSQQWVRRLRVGNDAGTSLPYADAVKQVADDVAGGSPPPGW